MAQQLPKMAQNYPQMAQKWRLDLRTFSAIFFYWKSGSAIFSAFRMYVFEQKHLNFTISPEISFAFSFHIWKRHTCILNWKELAWFSQYQVLEGNWTVECALPRTSLLLFTFRRRDFHFPFYFLKFSHRISWTWISMPFGNSLFTEDKI